MRRGLLPSQGAPFLLPDPPLSSSPQAAWSTRAAGRTPPTTDSTDEETGPGVPEDRHPPDGDHKGASTALPEDRRRPRVGPLSAKTVHGSARGPQDRLPERLSRTAVVHRHLPTEDKTCNPALKDTRTGGPKGGQCLGRGRLEGEEESGLAKFCKN